MPPAEFILASTKIVPPEGSRHAGVHIRDGKIVRVCEPPDFPGGISVEDVGNLTVMPGLVDTHVHINEPGRTEWEGFETATKAAAAGGITTLVDMPLNASPVPTTKNNLKVKLDAAQNKMHVDCGFWGGVIPGNENELEALLGSGALGLKAFLTH